MDGLGTVRITCRRCDRVLKVPILSLDTENHLRIDHDFLVRHAATHDDEA